MFGPQLLTLASALSLFTVPAGHVYVVRHLHMVNSSTSTTQMTRFNIGSSALTGNRVFHLTVLPDQSFIQEVRLPLVAGETMWGQNSVAATCALTVSGYDFLVG